MIKLNNSQSLYYITVICLFLLISMIFKSIVSMDTRKQIFTFINISFAITNKLKSIISIKTILSLKLDQITDSYKIWSKSLQWFRSSSLTHTHIYIYIYIYIYSNFKYHVSCTDGKISVRINLSPGLGSSTNSVIMLCSQ